MTVRPAPSSMKGTLGSTKRSGLRVLWWVTGVAAVVTLIVGGFFEHFESAARALDAAPVCSAGTAQGTQCLESRPATVEQTGTTNYSDATSYWIDLGGLGRFPEQVVMSGRGDGVWAVAADGDKVTATLWRGTVVRVEDDGVVSATTADPGVRAAEWLGGTSIPLSLTVVLLWGAAIARRRRRRAPAGPQAAAAALVLTTGMVVFPLVLTFTEQIEWWQLPASLAGAAVFVLPGWGIVAVRLRRRRTAAIQRLL